LTSFSACAVLVGYQVCAWFTPRRTNSSPFASSSRPSATWNPGVVCVSACAVAGAASTEAAKASNAPAAVASLCLIPAPKVVARAAGRAGVTALPFTV
jgi:hypothetical protein